MALNQVIGLNLPFVLSDSWVKLVHYPAGAFSAPIFFGAWGRHLWDGAAVAALLAGAWAQGAAIGRWVRRGTGIGDAWLPDLGLGLAACGLAVLGAGLAGLFHPAVAWGIVLAGLVRWNTRQRQRFAFGWAEVRAGMATGTVEARLLWAALGIMGGTCLVMALGPEVGWDPAYYHLRLPKLYALAHKIYYVPSIYPSHYPQAIEMLYGFGWLLAGEGGARLVNVSFWPACGVGMFRLAGLMPSLGRGDVLRAVALAMTIPLLGTLASENYIDLGLSLFELLALRAAWRGRHVEAAVFLGCAMGAKYTAVVAAGALAVALFSSGETGLKGVAKMAAISAVPVLPWLARNTLFTGDPVAPFFYARLGTLEWSNGMSQTAMVEVIPKLIPGTWSERAHSLLVGLWDFLNCKAFAVYPPFIFAMLPGLALRWRGFGGFLKVFVLTGTVVTLVISPDGRYWQPYALPLAVLAAALWRRIADTGSRVLRMAVPAVAFGSIALGSGFHTLDMHRMFTSYWVALGLEPVESFYLRVRVPSPWYAITANILNYGTPRGERIAVVSDVQAYMLNRDAFFDCDAPGSRRWIWRLPQRRGDEAGLDRQFRQWNVRAVWHIRGKAIAASAPESWKPADVRLWARWWNRRAHLTHQRGEVAIYRLGPPGAATTKLDLPGPQDWILRDMLKPGATHAGRKALYREALAMGADSGYMRGVYGELAIGEGDMAEGIAALRAALRIDPGYAALWFALTRGLIKAGDRAGARAALDRGKALSPQADELAELGTALGKMAP